MPDEPLAIELRESSFGRYYHLDPHLHGATVMVVAEYSMGGLRPQRLLLTHQLYAKDVPASAELWVTPVLAPWVCVTGREAGQTHGPLVPVPDRAALRAEVLREAAEHLEAARGYDWAGKARKIDGWATAARELRRMAERAPDA